MPKQVAIIYKADFVEAVAGVGVRYLSVARELVRQGTRVTIIGTRVPDRTVDGIDFVSTGDRGAVWRSLKAADAIIAHGGGPVFMLLLAFLAAPRRKIMLDAFAPHWLELFVAEQGDVSSALGFPRLLVKVFFNWYRLVWARLFFHVISAGTARQLDLFRGITSVTGRLDFDRGFAIITGGCEPRAGAALATRGDVFRFGWIGGFWGWFDPSPIVRAVADMRAGGLNAEMHFVGLTADQERSVLSAIDDHPGRDGAIVFRLWSPYAQRLTDWSDLHATIVWAQPTIENDYASRTRNFDSITLGLPVIQNRDSFWADILERHDAGLVVDSADELTRAMHSYVEDAGLWARQAGNIARLDAEFGWPVIAERYADVLRDARLPPRRWAGVLAIPFLTVSLLWAFVLNMRAKTPAG